MRAVSVVVVPALTVLLLAACSDDSGQATCLREGVARVCAEREDGAVMLSGVGLRPGSDVEVAAEEIGAERFPVGANGEPDDAVGIAGTTSSPLEVQVEATTATGATLAGPESLDQVVK